MVHLKSDLKLFELFLNAEDLDGVEEVRRSERLSGAADRDQIEQNLDENLTIIVIILITIMNIMMRSMIILMTIMIILIRIRINLMRIVTNLMKIVIIFLRRRSMMI